MPLLVSDLHFDLLPLDDLVQGQDRRKAEAPDQPDVERGILYPVRFDPDHKTGVEKLEMEQSKTFKFQLTQKVYTFY